MKRDTLKLKKGGIDTIIAYIVVMLPLFYVVVYMVATIYHFSVQTYMNQVLKEATVMASTYGLLTGGEEGTHISYITNELADVLGKTSDGKDNWTISYFIRHYNPKTGMVGEIKECTFEELQSTDDRYGINKGDIIGILVESVEPSLLGTVGSFNIFSAETGVPSLGYSAYREEIIRNERPDK